MSLLPRLCGFFLLLGVALTCDIARTMKTNQLLLVAHQSCRLFIESPTPEESAEACPRTFGKLPSLTSPCNLKNVRAHLIRDSYGRTPSVIMYIGEVMNLNGHATPVLSMQGYGFTTLETITYPSRANVSAFFTRDLVVKRGSADITQRPYSDPWKFTIFDTNYRVFYVVTREGFLYSYLFDHLDPMHFKQRAVLPQMLAARVHDDCSTRENWMEDPYGNTVYYTTRVNGTTMVYRVPMDRLFQTLLHGTPGEHIHTFFGVNRVVVAVSGGVMISRVNAEDGTVTTYMTDLNNANPDDSNSECACAVGPAQGRDVSLMLIRDWDYCVIRYGQGERSYCDDERRQWLVENGFINVESQHSALTIWILLALLCVFLLIVIYLAASMVRWRRKYSVEVEKQERVPVPYYAVNPGDYSNMEHMDVSVDRWNY